MNDTEALEVDICACVGGVGVSVCAAMIWTDVFVGFDVIMLQNMHGVLCVFPPIKWTDVFVCIIVLKNVGFIEAELLRGGKCADVNLIGVVVFPINISVRSDDGGDLEFRGLSKVNL